MKTATSFTGANFNGHLGESFRFQTLNDDGEALGPVLEGEVKRIFRQGRQLQGGGAAMNKPHYTWWGCVKAIIRAYPGRTCNDLSGVAKREYEAVQAAVGATERMLNGTERLKVIRLVHWDRTRTLEGAALTVPCSRSWAAKWQKDFFEEVAKNMGLLD